MPASRTARPEYCDENQKRIISVLFGPGDDIGNWMRGAAVADGGVCLG